MKTILSKATRHGLLLVLLAFALAPTGSQAQTSQYMSYQGFLTDGNGNALGSTNTGPKAYDVVFRMWDAATGGNELFSELQTVTVDNGYFSVLLGQGTAYSAEPTLHVPLTTVFTNSGALSRYVEVTVLGIGTGGFITILPRLQLVSSPFAFQAANALNVTGANVISVSNLATNLGVWLTSNTNIYRTGGNVGINTTTPGAPLDVTGNIHASGNVGIGTLTPGAPLDVNGNIQLEGTHLIYNAANPVIDFGGGTLNFRSDTTAGNIASYTTPMSLLANGNLNLTGSGNGYVFADRTGGNYPTWTWYANGGTANLYNSSTSANAITVAANGNVGIGTTGPAVALEVNGNLQIDAAAGEHLIFNNAGAIIDWGSGGSLYFRADTTSGNIGSFSTPMTLGATGDLYVTGGYYFYDRITTTSYPTWTWYANGGTALLYNTSGGNVMTVTQGGNVGIGTQTPGFPLEVGSSTIVSSSGYAYGDGGYLNEGYSANVNVSIHAVDYMLAPSFLANSDARIKKPLHQSNPSEDLDLLNKIKVTDFIYVDKVAMGNGVHKKVIAQELEQVYPQAVNKTINFVPDIYALATGMEQKEDTLRLTMEKPHGLRAGEKVKWIDDKGAVTQSVVSKVVSDVAFEVKFEGKISQAFVYGKEVKDFRVVDYEAISMLNVSATQELAKRLGKLEARESRLAELEQKAARVETLEQELADLKKTVTQLALAAKEAKLTPLPAHTPAATQVSFATSSLEH